MPLYTYLLHVSLYHRRSPPFGGGLFFAHFNELSNELSFILWKEKLNKVKIQNLRLETPIFYEKILNPASLLTEILPNLDEEREFLFCFELDELQYINFEPKIEFFPGKLIWGGEKKAEIMPESENLLELPAGNYVFTQEREFLDKSGIANLAMEMQMEGLWQRYRLKKTLYLRYLNEDRKTVSQLFRPIT